MVVTALQPGGSALSRGGDHAPSCAQAVGLTPAPGSEQLGVSEHPSLPSVSPGSATTPPSRHHCLASADSILIPSVPCPLHSCCLFCYHSGVSAGLWPQHVLYTLSSLHFPSSFLEKKDLVGHQLSPEKASEGLPGQRKMASRAGRAGLSEQERMPTCPLTWALGFRQPSTQFQSAHLSLFPFQ